MISVNSVLKSELEFGVVSYLISPAHFGRNQDFGEAKRWIFAKDCAANSEELSSRLFLCGSGINTTLVNQKRDSLVSILFEKHDVLPESVA